MSSFTALKANKEKAKSYVNVSSFPRDSPSAANSPAKTLERDPDEQRNGIQGESRNVVTKEMNKSPPYQVPNDGLYSSLPPWLEIRVSDVQGRGIWATQSIRSGSSILSVKPHSHAISNRYLDTCCSACSASAEAPATAQAPTKLSRCTKCRAVWYCNAECQTSDWSIHKHECAALQRWFKAASAAGPSPEEANTSDDAVEHVVRPPSDAIRCMARILWKKQKKGFNSVWAKEIDNMQSHRITLSKGDTNTKDIENQTQLAHSLVQYLGVSSPQDLSSQFGIESAGALVDFISKFMTNTFTLSDPSLTPIGACVSPLAALLNHSCDPNVVAVFPGVSSNENKKDEPRMEVVALRDIAPGEEILTAYVDVTLPRRLRQKALKETYFFTCRCSLCGGLPPSRLADANDQMDVDEGVATPSKSEIPPDARQSMWCPRKCGGMCSLPDVESEDTASQTTSCTKCKTAVSQSAFGEILDAVRIGKEGLDKATKLQYTEPEKAKRLTSNLIPLLTPAGLAHSSHPLLAMMRLHQALLIDELPTLMQSIQSPSGASAEETLVSPEAKTNAQEVQAHLDDAIRIATKVVTGLTALLNPAHPVLGVALAELGRLLAVDEVVVPEGDGSKNPTAYPPSGPSRLKLAYDTLLRARAVLRVGFGTRNDGGNVGKAVREDIVRLEKEIEVWKTGVRNVLGGRAK
ncbi:n-lysine methyltransferase smyd2-like [Moniliophthora roreri MCA 2997]|uniref:N-lysine methyltransferase smyd2-like n=1 Tax=Moniliophthora roreri (strain MCA 2997) TaxID=1381753 RepID=V2X3M6_MONRO|nr:n-lysine methyltransferase smyd2-like [Moniliophthora roreri MCA 2997]